MLVTSSSAFSNAATRGAARGRRSRRALLLPKAVALAAFAGLWVAPPPLADARMPLLPIPGFWVHAPLAAKPAGAADGFPPASGAWISFRPVPLERRDNRSGLEAELRWLVSDEGPLRAAESRAESWLGLDDLDFGSSRLTMQKGVGDRIHVTTFTGYQASSQRQVRIEYNLGGTLYLRSEAKERGESAVSVRSDLRFW